MSVSFSLLHWHGRERFLSARRPGLVYLRAPGNNAAAVTAGVILRSTGADETMGLLFISSESRRIMCDRICLDRGAGDWPAVYARFRRGFSIRNPAEINH